MKSNFVVKNGKRETGEMSVFEAVEVAGNFKALSTEQDKIEIHSFCRHWALKKGGKINQMLVYPTKELADRKWWEIKPDDFDDSLEVVEVREFMIWYRIHDDKDFKLFYTDTPDLCDAIDEAINHLNGVVFAIDFDGEVVARYGVNYVRDPKMRR